VAIVLTEQLGILLCEKINKYLIHTCEKGDEQNTHLIKINGFCTHEGFLLKSQWKKWPCWAENKINSRLYTANAALKKKKRKENNINALLKLSV